ncbi:MAG: LysM peptidoglycan-binding domain-containing protein [Bacilli bacterium]|nr:LysM peptidoglycan-binding domain-containing protein [Bacilli bacterium]
MKSIVPYKKEISFGSKIAEITSMSLEHEIDLTPEEVHGNFIISGDYKSHEVSVNREPFLYKLPFSMEITDHVDLDTFQFEITDFSYDVLNDDTVEVDIEFAISAEELVEEEVMEVPVVSVEDVIKEEREEEAEEEPDLSRLIETPEEEGILTQILMTEDVEEKEQERVETKTMLTETKVVKEDMKESEETIIQNVNPMDDSYATYHIHIVNSGETVETICTMYHSNLGLLSEYNDMSQVAVGDKIIIPKEDE